MNRRARRLVQLVAAVVAGVMLLTGAVLRDTLTYYRTPSELSGVASGQHIRLAGSVVSDSLRYDGDGVRFEVTDGTTVVSVLAPHSLPRMFTEERQTVLEGSFDANRLFRADRVLAKHGTDYRAAPRVLQ